MNMNNLMAQATKMKKDIEKKQNEINNTIFLGKSQLVSIEMNGKREVNKIVIDSKILNDKEDLEILEDMITIAINDVLSKIDKKTNEEMSAYGSGLNGLF